MTAPHSLGDFQLLEVSAEGKRYRGYGVGASDKALSDLLFGEVGGDEIRVVPETKRRGEDFMGTGYGFILTKRVDSLFRCNDLKGWDSVSVSVKGEPVGSWFAPKLDRRGIPRDETGLVKDEDGIATAMNGLRFHVAEWDGRDFFRIGDFAGVVVTPRVIDLLVKEETKGWDARSVLSLRF